MIFLKKLFPYFLILILSFFAFKPMLFPGFFPIHDDTQITRVFEMSKALANGAFPVRWSMDLGFGYGYPIFNFYAPLSYYIGGFINLIGFNAIIATKLMMLVGIVMSGFFMYLFSKDFFGKAGGILSALLYVYAPYHGVDIFVRGDVAEFFAYAFIPLLFYGLYQIYKTNRLKFVLISSVGFAGIILSHNLTALIVAPFAFMFAIFLIYKNKKTFKNFTLAFLLGLALSAFYFIPTLLEMGYTNVLSQVGGGADFRDHFVCLYQLWTSPWGYGGSAKGCTDGISFMIGKYHIALSLVLIGAILYSKFDKKVFNFSKSESENFAIYFLFLLFGLVSIFLMLPYSQIVWQLIKPMEFLQYPWRFLLLTSFSLAFLGGGVLWIISKFVKGNWLYVSCAILFVGIVVVSMKFFIPQKTTYKSLDSYISKNSINWDISKISSEYMPKTFLKPVNMSELPNFSSLSPEVTVVSFEQNSKFLKMQVNSAKDTQIVVPIAYFPAWKAIVDKKEVSIAENKKGSEIEIPAGNHLISFEFRQTNIEIWANLISFAGLLALIAGIIYSRKKYDKI